MAVNSTFQIAPKNAFMGAPELDWDALAEEFGIERPGASTAGSDPATSTGMAPASVGSWPMDQRLPAEGSAGFDGLVASTAGYVPAPTHGMAMAPWDLPAEAWSGFSGPAAFTTGAGPATTTGMVRAPSFDWDGIWREPAEEYLGFEGLAASTAGSGLPTSSGMMTPPESPESNPPVGQHAGIDWTAAPPAASGPAASFGMVTPPEGLEFDTPAGPHPGFEPTAAFPAASGPATAPGMQAPHLQPVDHQTVLAAEQWYQGQAQERQVASAGRRARRAARNGVSAADAERQRRAALPRTNARPGMEPGYRQNVYRHQHMCLSPALVCDTECPLTGPQRARLGRRNQLWSHVPAQ